MKSNEHSDTKDTNQPDRIHHSIISPQTGSQVSDEFGGLKKTEAIDLFFKKLNSMLQSMKGHYQYDIDTVCKIDDLACQFCDLFKFDPNNFKDNSETLG